jgi:hypothetical protein
MRRTREADDVEVAARHLGHLVAVEGFYQRRSMKLMQVRVTVGDILQHSTAPCPHPVVLCPGDKANVSACRACRAIASTYW